MKSWALEKCPQDFLRATLADYVSDSTIVRTDKNNGVVIVLDKRKKGTCLRHLGRSFRCPTPQRRVFRSPQAPTFSPTAADDRHDGDIQAAETGEAYADYDNPPSPRWRGRLGTAVVVLCLAGLPIPEPGATQRRPLVLVAGGGSPGR